ncbi:substrate-binding domain-containing protein [Streptomyces sp. NBRC 110465]|uniref:substrate-binding domain-containing protein n=1 Tax=Streptomyces sp. NBRC 110465 TaxID=1897621 RepID=UPI00093559DC|nr:substrate-binding domain-containing protein [Streptomyces sp. NBRC 110465]
MRSLAEQARADEVKADRLCPAVKVRARGAHEGAEALAAGGEPDFQIRLPDSGLWLERAKGFGEGIPVSPSDPVATSPEAVAVVPSASRDLSRPRKTYPWAELVAGVLGSDRVRLGAADPARPWWPSPTAPTPTPTRTRTA